MSDNELIDKMIERGFLVLKKGVLVVGEKLSTYYSEIKINSSNTRHPPPKLTPPHTPIINPLPLNKKPPIPAPYKNPRPNELRNQVSFLEQEEPDNTARIKWIIERWNEVSKQLGLVKIIKLNTWRQQKLNTRLASYPNKREWIELFEAIRESKELVGKSWFNFDYVIRGDDTFEKVKNRAYAWLSEKSDGRQGRPLVNETAMNRIISQTEKHSFTNNWRKSK